MRFVFTALKVASFALAIASAGVSRGEEIPEVNVFPPDPVLNFILQGFSICTGRSPGAGEITTWQNDPLAQVMPFDDLAGNALVRAICSSEEAINYGTRKAYGQCLGRTPTAENLTFWFNFASPLPFNVKSRYHAVHEAICNSVEARAIFVRSLYNSVLMREAESEEALMGWVNSGLSKFDLLLAFNGSPEAVLLAQNNAAPGAGHIEEIRGSDLQIYEPSAGNPLMSRIVANPSFTVKASTEATGSICSVYVSWTLDLIKKNVGLCQVTGSPGVVRHPSSALMQFTCQSSEAIPLGAQISVDLSCINGDVDSVSLISTNPPL